MLADGSLAPESAGIKLYASLFKTFVEVRLISGVALSRSDVVLVFDDDLPRMCERFVTSLNKLSSDFNDRSTAKSVSPLIMESAREYSEVSLIRGGSMGLDKYNFMSRILSPILARA